MVAFLAWAAPWHAVLCCSLWSASVVRTLVKFVDYWPLNGLRTGVSEQKKLIQGANHHVIKNNPMLNNIDWNLLKWLCCRCCVWMHIFVSANFSFHFCSFRLVRSGVFLSSLKNACPKTLVRGLEPPYHPPCLSGNMNNMQAMAYQGSSTAGN